MKVPSPLRGTPIGGTGTQLCLLQDRLRTRLSAGHVRTQQFRAPAQTRRVRAKNNDPDVYPFSLDWFDLAPPRILWWGPLSNQWGMALPWPSLSIGAAGKLDHSCFFFLFWLTWQRKVDGVGKFLQMFRVESLRILSREFVVFGAVPYVNVSWTVSC